MNIAILIIGLIFKYNNIKVWTEDVLFVEILFLL